MFLSVSRQTACQLFLRSHSKSVSVLQTQLSSSCPSYCTSWSSFPSRFLSSSSSSSSAPSSDSTFSTSDPSTSPTQATTTNANNNNNNNNDSVSEEQEASENFKYKHMASVNRRGLFKAKFEEPPPGSKPPTNAFIDELKMNIGVRGLLSVNEWMRQCLGHPEFGYYTSKEEVIGADGDFTTSPEISPVFGELLAIWCVRAWQKMGNPKTLRIVECGPGKGTLMKHFIRIAKRFPDFRQAIKCIHLVETSPRLRELQQKALDVTIDPKCIAKEDNLAQDKWGHTSGDRVMVRWHWQLQDIPRTDPVLVIANEFFDALPTHQFKFDAERGWLEKMIDLDLTDSPNHFRWVLTSTPATGLLPRHLYPSPPPGHPTEFERSFIGMSVMQEIAQLLRKAGGAALIIDYGEDKPQGNTVQAVAGHQFVDVLSNPGKQDITAHVDFSALREAVQSLDPAKGDEKQLVVHKVIRQRILLRELGFITRLNQLIDMCKTDEEKEKVASAIRLIEDDEPYSMGTLFKAFCVADEKIGVPDGFHEDA